MDGLRMTRCYRVRTYWFRAVSRFISRFTFDPLESLGVKFGLIKSQQRTLMWTKRHDYDPPLQRLSRRATSRHTASPSIEFTLYPDTDPPYSGSAIQETPAMAHSLFPPAMTTRRARNESDASSTEPSLPIFEQYRSSDDSNRPLVQRPSDVHRSRAPSTDHSQAAGSDRHHGSEITDGRSSSEYMLSPVSLASLSSPPAERSVVGGWLGLHTLQNRQRYQRANSDPGSPSFDNSVGAEQGGLGISVHDQDEERGGPAAKPGEYN
jgi:hypothetical protein